MFSRGEKLFSDNSIQITSKSAGTYEGLVAGSGGAPYEVSVDALLNAECTCQAWIKNANRFCKHCVAIALVWEDDGGPTLNDEMTSDVKKATIVRAVQQLSPDECKKILVELAKNEPDLAAQLLLDDD